MEADFKTIANYLHSIRLNNSSIEVLKAIKLKAWYFLLYEDRLYRKTKNVLRMIPERSQCMEILQGMHDEIGYYTFLSNGFW